MEEAWDCYELLLNNIKEGLKHSVYFLRCTEYNIWMCNHLLLSVLIEAMVNLQVKNVLSIMLTNPVEGNIYSLLASHETYYLWYCICVFKQKVS